MRKIPRILSLTPAAMLCAMATMVCGAADAPATAAVPAASASPQPAPEIGNIDEIWVRGKRLTEVIVDAEDEFFKLYNKANKNSDYDIHCGTTSLSADSMIMIRKCVPGFLVYNSYNALNNTVNIGSGSFGWSGGYDSCSGPTSVIGSNGEISYYGGYCSSPSYGYSGYTGTSGYVSPPAGLLLMERGPAYVNNVVGVVSRDPELIKKANHLVDLYNELESLQHNFVAARKAGQKVRSGLKGTRPAGPRVL
jgi:hypothetical protein